MSLSFTLVDRYDFLLLFSLSFGSFYSRSLSLYIYTKMSIQFTPLCYSDDGSCMCYLLRINKFHVLLDCGWNETFDIKLLEPLKASDLLLPTNIMIFD